jgi:hypothetical protein
MIGDGNRTIYPPACRPRADGERQTTRDFFADQASELRRPLSEAEIAATGGLVLDRRLPDQPQKPNAAASERESST